MADLLHRLPLLVLVVVLLLVVVFFNVCFVGLVPLAARRRRSSKKADRIDRRLGNGRPACTTSGSSNRQHSAGSVAKRPYNPSLYAQLPSHEIPLPPSDDEGGDATSSTLPSRSGSTQEWAATQSRGGRRVETPWSYTSLLNEGLCDDDGNAAVDLSFQLSNSSGAAATHTQIINPHPGVDCANNTHDGVCGPRDGGLPQSLREGGGNRNESTSTEESVRVNVRSGCGCHLRREAEPALLLDNSGRRVCVRKVRTCTATGGSCGQSAGRPCINVERRQSREGCNGSTRTKRTKLLLRRPRGVTTLTVTTIATPTICQTLGRWGGRRRTAEWLRGRVPLRKSMGVTREAVDCGKKWDNLMQQFKKVHKFQNLSGWKDYFKLASKARRSEGFSFVMDRSVYDEIEAMTKGDHTIHPKNLADMGAAGGVQMRAGAGAAGDTMATDGGGEAADEEQGSTKDSTFSARSGGGYGKRKNMRQQTFEVVAEVMDKHGALMASTMDSARKRQCLMMLRQCEILESEVEVQREHYAVADEANRMMSAHTVHSDEIYEGHPLPFLLIVAPQSHYKVTRFFKVIIVLDFFKVFIDHRCGSCRSPSRRGSFSPQIRIAPSEVRPLVEKIFFLPRSSVRRVHLLLVRDFLNVVVNHRYGSCRSPSRCGSFSPWIRIAPSEVRRRLVVKIFFSPRRSGTRGKKGENIPADTQGRERGRRHVPKAKRLHSEEASASLPLQRGRSWATANEEEDDDVFTMEEEAAEDNVPAPRGSSLQRSSDQSGARRLLTPPSGAQQMRAHNTTKAKEVVVDVGGEDDEPLESGRPEDDDMAAHQEATVICIAHAFRAAVQMGGIIDGGFISHDRLSRVADCFRLLLAACMWLMRMAGDDPCSHYEAFYFAKLVAKPTLVASMHRAFDHRWSIIRATNAVTERLGKANATFGEYPKYIPDWASCGIVFGHDATITGPEDAKRRDWLGSGPLEDDDDDDGKEDT
ncbi:hypothetical protein CBR_g37466 [Chara braunii]|uniref:Myb-like domain-containing protein n=1 Tax=Chara braunii TaxID=69332 RepID=A0A388LMZ0_CHABU|nr:hypothetical protein CBR_g37466 [Chara braunii]|eukprot:GBG83664.1 hypothetical protein CBR_g37466 [Chara braunii]